MKYLSIIFAFSVFSIANAQTAQSFLDSALVKKEQLKFVEGIQLCEKAIAVDSTLIDAYFYKAGFHTALINRKSVRADFKNYKAAIANYSKVLELNPNHAIAYFYRGGAHDAMGFLDDAIVDYQKAISINANQPEVYNSLGVCHAKKRNIDLALSYFDKATIFNPTYAKAYANKGNVYDMKYDLNNACKNWKKAIDLGYTGNQRRYILKCKKQ
jgi:tetratricopeptide (TPR) repeat protein